MEGGTGSKVVLAAGDRGPRPPVLFLSHSGVDTEAARDLKRRLEESPAGRQAGLKVWFDKDDLPAGWDWQESLELGIRESTAFAGVCRHVRRRDVGAARGAPGAVTGDC